MDYTFIMDYTFTVTRNRQSVTQGSATVYLNGKEIVTFEDPIELVADDQKYFGLKFGSWASTKPDGDFIYEALFHPHEELYHYSDKVREILKEENMEKPEHGSITTPQTLSTPEPELSPESERAYVRELLAINVDDQLTAGYLSSADIDTLNKHMDSMVDQYIEFAEGYSKGYADITLDLETDKLDEIIGNTLKKGQEQVLNQMNSMEMG